MAAPNIVNVSTITGITSATTLGVTSTTTLLSNPAASNKVFKINSIIVANTDGVTSYPVYIDWYNGTAGFKLASTITVPNDATLVVLGKDTPIYLEENCSIRGGSSVASKLDCIISYESIS